MHQIRSSVKRRVKRALQWLLSPYAARRLRAWFVGPAFPRVGSVRFGDLRRVTPISREFGFDRGQPIDRYYIERFLASNASAIRGKVLEIGHNTYTRRYGAGVTHNDVLHVDAGHPHVTIVADLTDAGHLPGDTYDAILFVQTLHLIFDMGSVIQTLHRMLRPGGVLLATFPGISNIDPGEWGDQWCWSLTVHSARRLFGEYFGGQVAVEGHGNVLAAIAFLHGLAAAEFQPRELDVYDPSYDVLITVRATKAVEI